MVVAFVSRNIFGRDVIEVATFRGHHTPDEQNHVAQESASGRLLRDNVYGTIEEDAQRRDFTINAIYYNIADCSLHDFADGIDDIEQRTLRLIGQPEQRYREDRADAACVFCEARFKHSQEEPNLFYRWATCCKIYHRLDYLMSHSAVFKWACIKHGCCSTSSCPIYCPV